MKKLQLNSGTSIAYEEYGARSGYPMIYIHGFTASRKAGQFLAEFGQQFGVRIISIDRPGYGESDFIKFKKVSDFCQVLAEIADQFGFKKFSILSTSGGSIYAATCAKCLTDRIESASIVSGITPFRKKYLSVSGVPRKMQFLPVILKRFFFLVRFYFGLQRFVYKHSPRLYMRWKKRVVKGVDTTLIQRYEKLGHDLAGEGLKRTEKGIIQDLRLAAKDWDFCDKSPEPAILIFHGENDQIAPTPLARELHKTLVGSELFIIKNTQHFLFPEFGREIFTKIMKYAQK